MARIPETEIERLKQDVSLQRLAESRGIVLKKHGSDLMGLCPFHDDKEPSLVITPSKNLWHCLGACQSGGTVIDWVMKSDGVSFRHAVELLREGLSSLAASSSPPVKQSTVKKLPTQLHIDADDQILLNQVVEYYHAQLKQSPEALAYLKKRGLVHAEVIDHFKLGFANRSLSYRVPQKNRKTGAELRGQLQRIGLYRNSGHEHFNGSLIIPVLDEQDHVTEVYGRKIRDDLRKGTPKHLYLPGPHKGIWNHEVLKASTEIILCESLIDALTFWCAGYRNVTCSYGIESFTVEHLNAFKETKVERVLIAYDRDTAGEHAATALAAKLIKAGIDCYRIQFPKKMDANEYALSVTPASKSLGLVIRKAVWLGNGEAPCKPATVATANETKVKPPHIESVTKEKEGTLPPLAAEPETPLPAAVIPEAPQADIEADIKEQEVVISLGDRRYRVRGLQQNLSINQMKVNVMASSGDAIHVDTFDLYTAKARTGFIKQAALELQVEESVIKKDLGKVLLKLEALQEECIKNTLEPKNNDVVLNEEDTQQALELLTAPDLMNRILKDFTACGVIGEETNKLVGYLSAVSRKLARPLAVMVQSSSAAGKSALMEAVLSMMPEEDKVQYSAMTGQSLFYMQDGDLAHKILAIAEEEGAQRASYALKLLQSEGKLNIASTGKDPQTGRLITHEYEVQGPVMIFSTTTSIEPDEELLNRCIVLGVDEGREQTKAIHTLQRQEETLDGLFGRAEKESIIGLHQNAQRLLKPINVVNPYAHHLTFLDDQTRTRRDHMKYLTLIKTITLLHQHQRSIETETRNGITKDYIEVSLADIELANQLAHDVLGKSLDELPPQTRRLLMLIDDMVTTQCEEQAIDRNELRFSRKAVREVIGWCNTQLRVHLERLVDMEYLLVHRGGRGQSFVYELLYDGQGKDGQSFVVGLIEVEQLKQANTTTQSWRGEDPPLAGSKRPQNGAFTGAVRSTENNALSLNNSVCDDEDENEAKNAHPVKKNNPASYMQAPALIAKQGNV